MVIMQKKTMQESKPLYVEYRLFFLFEHAKQKIKHSWKDTAFLVKVLSFGQYCVLHVPNAVSKSLKVYFI